MYKSIIIISIGFVFSQCSFKKQLYYDEHNNRVSYKEFHKLLDYKWNIDVYYETDSTKVAVLIDRLRFFKWPPEKFESVKKSLAESVGTKLDFSKDVVIYYYDSMERGYNCAYESYPLTHTKRQKLLHADINTYYMVNSGYTHEIDVYEEILRDTKDVLQSEIFRHRFRCGNYVSIRPDGSYAMCIGDGCDPYYVLSYSWEGLE